MMNDLDLSGLSKNSGVPFPEVENVERISIIELFEAIDDVDKRFQSVKGFDLVGSQIINSMGLSDKYTEHQKRKSDSKVVSG